MEARLIWRRVGVAPHKLCEIISFEKHLSAETRNKISTKLRGNKNSLGVTRSEDTREKISASKSKPVEMRLNGELITTFSSAKDAEAKTGISRKNISLCCLHRRKRAGSYEWNFA